MKLAVDCRLIGESGIGTIIENIVKCLLSDYDFSYVLIGNSDILSMYETSKECEIVDCRYKSFSLRELTSFPTYAVNNCDAFFTPNFNIPMGIKVPIYSMIHDVVFFDVPGIWPWFKKIIFEFYIKRALAVSKTVFTVSEFSKSRILTHCKTKTKIIVAYGFLNSALLEYRKKHTIEGKRNGIIYLGNIKKHKGISILLDAYGKLIASGVNDMPLTILGRVDSRSKDTSIIEKLRTLKDHVKFVSHISDEELYDIISHSEVLVSPSLYEGFGLPPLEALALGTPAIISDIPVYKEVYKNLPVEYFHSNCADDLYMKLKSFKPKVINVFDMIVNTYNYQRTTELIVKNIEKNIDD